ncbi:hypothetical protein PIB30_039828, partial [Stylosanthes scabra]|nr:hypothetical protein [Stylosanthes scabra]
MSISARYDVKITLMLGKDDGSSRLFDVTLLLGMELTVNDPLALRVLPLLSVHLRPHLSFPDNVIGPSPVIVIFDDDNEGDKEDDSEHSSSSRSGLYSTGTSSLDVVQDSIFDGEDTFTYSSNCMTSHSYPRESWPSPSYSSGGTSSKDDL